MLNKRRRRQIDSLRDSIKKWEKIVEGKGVDKGVENCPCCKLYYGNIIFSDTRCVGCPVSEFTGQTHCIETPYILWIQKCRSLSTRQVINKKTKNLAIKELDFLKLVLIDLLLQTRTDIDQELFELCDFYS